MDEAGKVWRYPVSCFGFDMKPTAEKLAHMPLQSLLIVPLWAVVTPRASQMIQTYVELDGIAINHEGLTHALISPAELLEALADLVAVDATWKKDLRAFTKHLNTIVPPGAMIDLQQDRKE